ncbi:hypothetical protein [Pseudoalteromonas marina]|uniref:hypothetical protein n=1 Tax=Pseudoalteromonas marina TaxID=267375 RepID=UPI0027354832|nr:hypothetical protein [Pseudoalteromonas marina]MDP2487676.1 hypothetical protein [Pseudoalteromonas marina]
MKKVITVASIISFMSFSAVSTELVRPLPTDTQKYNVTVVKLPECPSMDKVLEAPKNLISIYSYATGYGSNKRCELSIIHSKEKITGEITYADIDSYGNGGPGSQKVAGIYTIKL